MELNHLKANTLSAARMRLVAKAYQSLYKLRCRQNFHWLWCRTGFARDLSKRTYSDDFVKFGCTIDIGSEAARRPTPATVICDCLFYALDNRLSMAETGKRLPADTQRAGT